MPAAGKKTQEPRISDDAVEKATGKRWEQWFTELDHAGAAAWPHKQIAKHVHEGYLTTFWWAQSIAVAYENKRGLREKHEMPDGYQVQRQKRINASPGTVWKVWSDPKRRQEWLPESADATVRKSARTNARFASIDPTAPASSPASKPSTKTNPSAASSSPNSPTPPQPKKPKPTGPKDSPNSKRNSNNREPARSNRRIAFLWECASSSQPA